MEGVPFSLQGYDSTSPASPGGNFVPPSPFADYGYSADMPNILHYHNVDPQGVMALTGTEDFGNHGGHGMIKRPDGSNANNLGARPPPLQINTGVLGNVYDQIVPYPCPDSASTNNSMPSSASSVSFLPTPDETRIIQVSDDGKYKRRVGSDAMIAASTRRRKKPGSFYCKYCGRNLTSSHNLKYHQDAHFDIRPYKCNNPSCSFTTTAPATAKRHLRTCKFGQS